MAQIVETNTWLKAFLKVSGIHPTPHGWPKNLSRLPLHLLTVASIALHGSITAVLPLPLHPFTFPPIPFTVNTLQSPRCPYMPYTPSRLLRSSLTVPHSRLRLHLLTVAPSPPHGCPYTPSRLHHRSLTVAHTSRHLPGRLLRDNGSI